jgi:acyl-CoA thioester hydrolase
MAEATLPGGAPAGHGFGYAARIYWEDTDAGGVVYHASYVRLLDRARVEWLRARGTGQEALRARGLLLAVRAMTLDFLAPARLDDEVVATVELRERRGASFAVAQELRRGPECLLRAQVRIACLTAADFRPHALPPGLVPDPTPGDSRCP